MALRPTFLALSTWLSVTLIASQFLQSTNGDNGITTNCYLPNGTDRNSITGLGYNAYQPTAYSKDGIYQMCCATNREGIDTPRVDGLCASTNGQVWRESCTDHTWKSPSCLKLCVNGTDETGYPMVDNDEHVTPCRGQYAGSYCCGYNATECCDQGKGLWVATNGTVTTKNPNSTDSSPANTTSSDQNVVTNTPLPPASPSGLGAGAIAGIVIGTVAGAAIIAMAIWVLIRRRRMRTKDGKTRDSNGPGETKREAETLPENYSEEPSTELDGAAQLHEMSSPNFPHELPGSGGYRELQ